MHALNLYLLTLFFPTPPVRALAVFTTKAARHNLEQGGRAISSGSSEKRAVVDVSAKDFSPGLSYVAVSRVKTLNGIMLDAPIDHQFICGKVTPERDPPRLDAVWRQAHLPADADEVDELKLGSP
ncbi:hypothetical protein E4U58_006321 [Claviceps cyperi]|nr:hypothetical protein E4U58_006321 [Claviceps cyperi]